jgi:hypothetical protein
MLFKSVTLISLNDEDLLSSKFQLKNKKSIKTVIFLLFTGYEGCHTVENPYETNEYKSGRSKYKMTIRDNCGTLMMFLSCYDGKLFGNTI